MKKVIRTISTRLWRVQRDIERKIDRVPEADQAKASDLLYKTDGRLDRNPLKGLLGDALHAVLCGVGLNIRLLLKKLRHLGSKIRQWILALLCQPTQPLMAA